MSSTTSKSSTEGCLSVKFSMMHIATVALLSFLVGTLVPSIIPRSANKPGGASETSDELERSSSSASSGDAPSSWCASDATCYNTDLCKPCSRRYLIILATGRSASTTLMNMVGELPGVRMAGENNDLLGRLKEMEDAIEGKLEEMEVRFGDMTQYSGSWRHNPLINGSLACVSQQLIETFNPPMVDEEGHFLITDEATKILGFKTIRLLHGTDESKDVDLAHWLIDTMPCARFLVNIRSAAIAQASSQSSAFGLKSASADAIRKKNRRMRNIQKILGSSRARLLDSAKWTGQLSLLNDAVAWLGYSGDCNFTKALEYNTKDDYSPGDVDKSDLMVDVSKCRYIGDETRR